MYVNPPSQYLCIKVMQIHTKRNLMLAYDSTINCKRFLLLGLAQLYGAYKIPLQAPKPTTSVNLFWVRGRKPSSSSLQFTTTLSSRRKGHSIMYSCPRLEYLTICTFVVVLDNTQSHKGTCKNVNTSNGWVGVQSTNRKGQVDEYAI